MKSAINSDVNPFSTRFVRPGAIEYLFPEGLTAEALLDRLENNGWCGAIVGPHGSGKSTLLAALHEPLERRGRSVVSFTLTAGQRRLPLRRTDVDSWDAATQVVVDGYEQLGALARIRLHFACWRAGCGLLVTSHRPVCLATLLVTKMTVALAGRVIERVGGSHSSPLPPEQLAHLLERRQGNLREVLFDLYDLYRSQGA